LKAIENVVQFDLQRIFLEAIGLIVVFRRVQNSNPQVLYLVNEHVSWGLHWRKQIILVEEALIRKINGYAAYTVKSMKFSKYKIKRIIKNANTTAH
jgi:hypothetical protein